MNCIKYISVYQTEMPKSSYSVRIIFSIWLRILEIRERWDGLWIISGNSAPNANQDELSNWTCRPKHNDDVTRAVLA